MAFQFNLENRRLHFCNQLGDIHVDKWHSNWRWNWGQFCKFVALSLSFFVLFLYGFTNKQTIFIDRHNSRHNGAIPLFATEKEPKRNFLYFTDVTLVVVDMKSEKFIKRTCLQQDLFNMTMVTIMFDTKSSESESFKCQGVYDEYPSYDGCSLYDAFLFNFQMARSL